MKPSGRSDCPVNAAIEVVGDRWTMLIIRDIVFGDRRQFRQLQSQMKEGIAPNILSDRLTKLVQAGVLTKAVQGPGRPTVYSLAEAGIQLVPVLATLGGWGARHGGIPDVLRQAPQDFETAGPDGWAEFMDDLRRRHLVGTPTRRRPG